MSAQSSLDGGEVSKSHEFKITYSGPSFEKGMRIQHLIGNLRSVEDLVQNIADVNYEKKFGVNSGKDIKEIRVNIKEGSVVEEIIVLFNNPELRSTVLSVMVALFFYLKSRKDSKETEERMVERIDNTIQDRIEELIDRGQLKNVRQICAPLETSGDKFEIIENNVVKIEINTPAKTDIEESITEIESEPEQISEEDLQGYINAVDIDTTMRKFHPDGLNKSVRMNIGLSPTAVLGLVGQHLKIRANVIRKGNSIKRIDILNHTVLQRKLNEFEPLEKQQRDGEA